MTETPAPNAPAPEGQSKGTPSSEASGGASDSTTKEATKAEGAGKESSGGDGKAAKPAKPENLGDNYWDAEKGAVKLDDLLKDHTELSTKAAAEAERRKGVPEKPDGYKLELPKDLDLPENYQFSLDPTEPVAADLQTFAHERGLSQDDVTAIMGIAAKREIAQIQRVEAAVKDEIKKLGENGMARVDEVKGRIMSVLGEDGYKALAPMIFTAKQVEAFESLLAKATNGGVASFTGKGRETKDTGKLTEDQYSKMSPNEKLTYAFKHSAKPAGTAR